MILSILLGIVTFVIVALHGITIYAGYHLPRHAMRKSDVFALSVIAVSGLLHVINFIR